MKKISDIMNEMGFRKDAPNSVKEAFIKHLIKNATGVELETPFEKLEKENQSTKGLETNVRSGSSKPAASGPVQLSFPFTQDLGPGKKVS